MKTRKLAPSKHEFIGENQGNLDSMNSFSCSTFLLQAILHTHLTCGQVKSQARGRIAQELQLCSWSKDETCIVNNWDLNKHSRGTWNISNKMYILHKHVHNSWDLNHEVIAEGPERQSTIQEPEHAEQGVEINSTFQSIYNIWSIDFILLVQTSSREVKV